MKIMDFNNENWEEFIVKLEGPGFCNFRYTSDGGTEWDCDGDLTLTEKLLNEYDVDVGLSLEFFAKHGGYCDCEVCFNVPVADTRDK